MGGLSEDNENNTKSMNKTIITGHLGQDAEIRDVGDTSVISFSVAVTERWKDKQGESKEQTTWFNCEKWGVSSVFASFLTKGTKVLVEGKMTSNEHEGKTYWKLRAQNIEFLTPKQESSTQPKDDLPF